MRLIEVKDYRRKVYLIPFGDLHLGSPYIDAEKIDGYLEWIKKNKAYVFLMGDLFDIATLDSATEVWGQQMSINNAIKVLVEKFTPIKKQIIGAIIEITKIGLSDIRILTPFKLFATCWNPIL